MASVSTKSKKYWQDAELSTFLNSVTVREKMFTSHLDEQKLDDYLAVVFIRKMYGGALILSARNMSRSERRRYGRR